MDQTYYDPRCAACRVARERNLTEWERNLVHDLSASGVDEILLRRVAALAVDARQAEDLRAEVSSLRGTVESMGA